MKVDGNEVDGDEEVSGGGEVDEKVDEEADGSGEVDCDGGSMLVQCTARHSQPMLERH
jgi:hypothetical protein